MLLIHCAVIILTAAQQVVLTYPSYALEVARVRARPRSTAFGVVLVVLVVLVVPLDVRIRAAV